MCIGIAAPAFAESAPVYDADAMQQDSSYDVASDQSADLPPPPPPGQEGGNAFIPVQPTISSVPSGPPLSMEQRVQRVEQQVNNMQTGDAAGRVESLQDQVQSLRAQVETLTHQLEQVQSQQKAMYSDMDSRLALAGTKANNPLSPPSSPTPGGPDDVVNANSSTNAAAATKSAVKTASKTSTKQADAANVAAVAVTDKSKTKSTVNQPNVAEEQQIYQTAYNLIKAKKYNDAVTALQGMLKKYPSGQFASNAHYWLGELYGLMGKNDQALVEFSTVVDTYPDSPRVSDAQLKVGLLLASQLKWQDAKSALKKVINRYPGSASARLAAEQLKQIKLAGH